MFDKDDGVEEPCTCWPGSYVGHGLHDMSILLEKPLRIQRALDTKYSEILIRRRSPLVHQSISTTEQIFDEGWKSVPERNVSNRFRWARFGCTLGPPKLVNPVKMVSLTGWHREYLPKSQQCLSTD